MVKEIQEFNETIDKLNQEKQLLREQRIALIMITIAITIFFAMLLWVNTTNSNQNNGLIESDKNFLIELEYAGGFCERLGLHSTLIIQELETGEKYGVPICVTELPQQIDNNN
jgi:hypothetical protein